MTELQKLQTAAEVLSNLETYRAYAEAARRSTDPSNRGRFAARAGVALKEMRRAAREHNAIAVG